MGGFCLLVELHLEVSAPAVCAAGLFFFFLDGCTGGFRPVSGQYQGIKPQAGMFNMTHMSLGVFYFMWIWPLAGGTRCQASQYQASIKTSNLGQADSLVLLPNIIARCYFSYSMVLQHSMSYFNIKFLRNTYSFTKILIIFIAVFKHLHF